MKYGVDTSVVLRVLTGQPELLALSVQERLKALWLDGVVLDVCDLVASETYFALQHSYGLSKERALNALRRISAHPGFRLSSQVIEALQTVNLDKAKPGFIDRVIHGTYVVDDESVMMTCEKDAKKLGKVEVIRAHFERST